MPLLTALISALVACGTDLPDDLAVVRDSAGITIVENAPDAAERVPRWAVGPEPTLSIGVAEGAPGYEFHRVLEAATLSDGRIAVLDWSSRQVRLFGSEGGLVGIQGGEGDGPGEYRSPQMLWLLPGDSIAVYDPRQDRVTVIATAARGGPELARVAPVRRGIMAPLPAGALDGGRRLVVLDRTLDSSTPIQPWIGVLWALSIDGLAAVSLMELRHGSFGRFPGGDEVGIVAGYPVFGGLAGWAMADGDRLVHGSGQAYALEVADDRARTRRVVRWYGPDLTVTEDDVRTWIDSMVAKARPERRPRQRQRWEATPVADTKTAHDAGPFLHTLEAEEEVVPLVPIRRGPIRSNTPASEARRRARRRTRTKRYQAAQRTRKRVEEIYGWSKTIGGLRRSRHVGRWKIEQNGLVVCAAYNLLRLTRLSRERCA